MTLGRLGLGLCLIVVCGGLASCGRSGIGARSSGRVEDGGRAEDGTGVAVPDANPGKDAPLATDTASGKDAYIVIKSDTQLSTCGNGIFDPGEECDDGNTQSGDGCSSLCKLECGFTCGCGDPTKICQYVAKCGDGILSAPEACDDGNQMDGDGCSANCELEPHWRCRVPGKRCTPICGDGILLGTETCDDGNTLAGDGCGETCLIEGAGQSCGDGVISGGEECDEGVFNNDTAYGGDGRVDSTYGEECDLGPFNGTSRYCTYECRIIID